METNINQYGTQRLLFHGGLNFVGRIMNQVLQFVFILMVSRQLGVDQFGVFSLLVVVYNVGFLVSKLGMDKGILRFLGIYSNEQKENDGRITSTISIALLMTFLTGLGFFLVVGVWGKEIISESFFSIPIMSVGLPIVLIGLPFALVLEVLSKSGIALGDILPRLIFRNIAVPLLRIAGFFLIVFWGLPRIVETTAAVYSGAMILSAVSVCFYFILAKPGISKIPSTAINWQDFVGFSISALALGLSVMIFNYVDMVMLGVLSETKEVGIYSAGKNLAFNLSIVNTSFAVIFSPMAAGFFAQKDFKHIRKTYRIITTITYVVNTPAFLIMVVFPGILLGLLGKGFTVGGNTLILLAICYFINGCMLHSQFTVLMAGFARTSFYYHTAALLVNIFLNWLLIPAYGSVGAAAATLSAVLFLNITFVYKAYKISGINPLPKHLLKYSAVFFLFFVVFKAIDYLITINLVTVVLLGATSYLLIITGSFLIDQSLRDSLKFAYNRFRETRFSQP